LIRGLALLLLLLLPSSVAAASAAADPENQLPATIDLQVPYPPTPMRANGKAYLVYELHVTNLGRAEVLLTQVDVVTEDLRRGLLVRYGTGELNTVIDRPGIPTPPPSGAPAIPPTMPDMRHIAGGMRAVVRIWIAFDDLREVPNGFRHRVSIETTGPNGAKTSGVIEGIRTEVRRLGAITLDPPVRGGTWLAANGPSNSSPHRRALLAVHGRARIAQRFAIDWIKFGDDGMPFHGDPTQNASWYGYGEEVVAAADGIVTEAQDGIPDNTPLSAERAVPITLDTVAGNHVVIEHERGRFALYAHLQPGTLKVKLGERVHKGQVIGRLGNSGNSDAPHIHFHVCDANSALGCEGVPYGLESFQVLGEVEMPADLRTTAAWTARAAQAPGTRAKELPLENELVRFTPPPARP
jgi:hypothetical protein